MNGLTLHANAPPPPLTGHLHMGDPRNPDGHALTVDSRSLLRDGRRLLPVMGEFHYARYPEAEWRDALLRMRMGGISIVATYVFWIHHEESAGKFDWSARRSLRRFVELCREVGLLAVVRCGPWCHGEVRNGGLPDWLLTRGIKTRSDDPRYLHCARRLYTEIAGQLRGQLWRDRGPVIGIQCENEYGGPAEHLLTLKQIAVEAGLDVPLYTRTGWPELSTPMPVGPLLPLFGGYPDGFWDRTTQEMPAGYRGAFLFTAARVDGAIATDQLGQREMQEESETALYPYFACEIGGGMERSYHRRIQIDPRDIEALALVKIGSGSSLQGYYMYHGGTNPEGRLSTLQESQATGYWNDLPVKSYDFQAPLGEFGQVREHYHRLRRLHLFLADFGYHLAGMPSVLPDSIPADADDLTTLRWAARTDGHGGFVFVSNYQRLQPLASKSEVRFDLCLADQCLHFPREPVTVPADGNFFWPFRLDLDGANLVYATAQPVCHLTDGDVSYFVFSETRGIPSEFVFAQDGLIIEGTRGAQTVFEERVRLQVLPGTGAAIRLRTAAGHAVTILLLDEEQSLGCWKGTLQGRERLFLTRSNLLVDGDTLRLTTTEPGPQTVAILPAPNLLAQDGVPIPRTPDGLLTRFMVSADTEWRGDMRWDLVQSAGPVRSITNGSQGVAEAPTDADFAGAAVWRLHLPPDTAHQENLLLQIRYVGDVARLYLDGQLLTDNFYNGTPFEIGLRRYAPNIFTGELLLKVLPLQRDASIYLPADAWPEFGDAESAVNLVGIEPIETRESLFTAG